MTSWVAHHCHVLRRVKLTNPYALARSSILRRYSQTPDGHVASAKLNSPNSAIIIPSSVVGTKPEHLVQYIEPVAPNRLDCDRFAVFLVTPTFAQWLLDDAAFVQKALRRAYANMLNRDMPDATVHALCAVVDKLPAPTSIQLAHGVAGLQNAVQLRMKEPPVAEAGFEGMAYATLRFSDSMPASSALPVDQAAISFVATKPSPSTSLFGDTMRLPLANTVFQTGRPSTMIYSTWEKTKAASDFSLKSSQHVTHHGIKMHSGASDSQQTCSLAVPLVPLTVPRKVEGSMGNIVRRVIGPDGKSMQASHELEQVVPQFYSARGESSQATMVWALVMPTEMVRPVLSATHSVLGRLPDPVDGAFAPTDDELWEKLWGKQPAAWNDLVPNALAAGARLHRVLSGGGGWGKKAGLLSLDPVATISESSDDGTFEPGDLSSALQQVTRDGDYIQFFISPSNSAHEPMDHFEKLKKLNKSGDKWSWELGTIPSTADALPTGSWQHVSSTSKEMFVFRSSFGALTEAGMTIKRRSKHESHEPFSLHGGSKLDVPFSRFSAINIGNHDAREDLMYKYLAPLPIPQDSTMVGKLHKGAETPSLLRLQRSKPAPEDDLNKKMGEEESTSKPVRTHTEPPRPTLIIRGVMVEGPDPIVHVVRRFNAKLREAQATVRDLTWQARVLMNTIRQALGHNMNPFVGSKPRKIRNEFSMKPYIKQLRETQATVQNLRREAQRLMGTIRRAQGNDMNSLKEHTSPGTLSRTRNGFSIKSFIERLDIRCNNIELSVTRSTKETAEILPFIHTRICSDNAYKSAIATYSLHTTLRNTLGAMILARQNHKHPHPMARGIMPLEKKLVILRSFTDDLFPNTSREARHPTPDDLSPRIIRIRNYLQEQEDRHPIIARLVLSQAAQRVEARNKLSQKELRTIEKIKALRKARRGEKGIGIRASAKIRWVLEDSIVKVDNVENKRERQNQGTRRQEQQSCTRPSSRIRKIENDSIETASQDTKSELQQTEMRERMEKMGMERKHRNEAIKKKREEKKALAETVRAWLSGTE